MANVYPAHREADVVLRDGTTVRIRPVRPDDEERLRRFLEGLSEESRTFRFFSPATDLAAQARRDSQIDYLQTFGFVATSGADDRVTAHALYATSGAGRAEVAFAVADDYHGRGLATLLLGQLAEVAVANGIHVFEADVLPSNYRMLDVFRQSGFSLEVRATPDALHVTFPTSFSPAALEAFEQREQIAAANALQYFLRPSSVAVIGASRRRGTV